MSQHVVIASSSISSEEYIPVIEKLESRGCEVTVYNSDRVIAGQDNFTARVSEEGLVNMTYNNRDISNDSVDALWYRKVADFQKPEDTEDKAKALLLQDEIGSFHQDIWQSLYEDNKWLNSPKGILRASNKLGQLIIGKQVGFSIPETLISSDWEAIQKSLINERGYKDIIVKMVRGVLIQDGQEMAMPTTTLSQAQVGLLSETTTSFPGIYQPYKQKFREWRITVVGQQVFPVSIYTDQEAKDDWRRHQNKSHVIFKSEAVNPAISQQCIDFLGKYSLSFGAFDFIESDEGEMTFLECNANGQYYRFEQQFGLPISDAIADELIKATGQSFIDC